MFGALISKAQGCKKIIINCFLSRDVSVLFERHKLIIKSPVNLIHYNKILTQLID